MNPWIRFLLAGSSFALFVAAQFHMDWVAVHIGWITCAAFIAAIQH